MEFEKLKELVKIRVSNKRYIHILSVVETAKNLIRIHNIKDKKIIEDIELSCLLHDFDKDMPIDYQQKIISEFFPQEINSSSEIWHQFTAIISLKKVLNINQSIQNAIMSHTTGHPEMDIVAKILYIADYIEPLRDFEEVEDVRMAAKMSVDEACFLKTKNAIEFLNSKGISVHSNTLKMFEIVSEYKR